MEEVVPATAGLGLKGRVRGIGENVQGLGFTVEGAADRCLPV